MRSFITAFLVTAVLAASASTAAARPADNGPQLPPQSQSTETPVGPSLPSGGGTEPIVLVLIGVAALAGAGLAGARVERRVHGADHTA